MTPGTTPRRLVSEIRTQRSAAGTAAARIVDLYLEGRYGGRSLGPSEISEMRLALTAVRTGLRGP